MLSFGMWFLRGLEEAELAGQQHGGTWPTRCHFSSLRAFGSEWGNGFVSGGEVTGLTGFIKECTVVGDRKIVEGIRMLQTFCT